MATAFLPVPLSAQPLSAFTRQPRRWVAPLIGMFGSVVLALLPLAGIGQPVAVYAAFCLGVGVLYLAMLPGCVHGVGMAATLAIANVVAGLALVQWPDALHGWLSVQTVIAALWLLRDRDEFEQLLASLLLGLNVGAVTALGWLIR